MQSVFTIVDEIGEQIAFPGRFLGGSGHGKPQGANK
jgi:hypothetical protein